MCPPLKVALLPTALKNQRGETALDVRLVVITGALDGPNVLPPYSATVIHNESICFSQSGRSAFGVR